MPKNLKPVGKVRWQLFHTDGSYQHDLDYDEDTPQADIDAANAAFIAQPHFVGRFGPNPEWRLYVRQPAYKHEWDEEHHRRRFLEIEYMGHTFPCDESAQQAIDQYVHLAHKFIENGRIPFDEGGRLNDDGTKSPTDEDRYWNLGAERFSWDTVDHQHVFMTAAEFVGLAVAICDRSYAIREAARRLKNAGVEADFEHDRHWPGYVAPAPEPAPEPEEAEEAEPDEDAS